MIKINLSYFPRGWIIGNFEPSIFKSTQIEVAIQEYKAGHVETKHFHKIATEVTIIIMGEAMFNDEHLFEGEGMIIKPNESNTFKAITDCKTLVIKVPSIPGDKYLK